jgi:hypothetical protein
VKSSGIVVAVEICGAECEDRIHFDKLNTVDVVHMVLIPPLFTVVPHNARAGSEPL